MSYDTIVVMVAAVFGIATGLAMKWALRDYLRPRNEMKDRALDRAWDEKGWGE